MKSTNQDYGSFKNDTKRLLALISRDIRIVVVTTIGALVVLIPALLH